MFTRHRYWTDQAGGFDSEFLLYHFSFNNLSLIHIAPASFLLPDSRLPRELGVTTHTRLLLMKETTNVIFTRMGEGKGEVLSKDSPFAHTIHHRQQLVSVSPIVNIRHLARDRKGNTTTTNDFITKLTTLGLGRDKLKGFSMFAHSFTYFSRKRERSTTLTPSSCKTNEASLSKRAHKYMRHVIGNIKRFAKIIIHNPIHVNLPGVPYELPPWPNDTVQGPSLAYKTQ